MTRAKLLLLLRMSIVWNELCWLWCWQCNYKHLHMKVHLLIYCYHNVLSNTKYMHNFNVVSYTIFQIDDIKIQNANKCSVTMNYLDVYLGSDNQKKVVAKNSRWQLFHINACLSVHEVCITRIISCPFTLVYRFDSWNGKQIIVNHFTLSSISCRISK